MNKHFLTELFVFFVECNLGWLFLLRPLGVFSLQNLIKKDVKSREAKGTRQKNKKNTKHLVNYEALGIYI